MPLLIKNCRLLINGKVFAKNILIKNGKISKITNKGPKAEKTIDAKGNFVLPGLIDCHVHFREPGLAHKEDFLTGSMAAAKGGVTTIFDMPNTLPPTTTIDALEQKRRLAAKSIVNYGLIFGATMDNIPDIKKAKNIAAVKLYMDYTTGDLKVDDFEAIGDIFKASKLTIIHAEDENIKQHTAYDINGGTDEIWLYLYENSSRFPFVKAVYGNSVYAFPSGDDFYEVYVTTSGYSIEKIKDTKRR